MGSKNKIILVPRLYNAGGVANYYSVLKEYLDHEFTYIFRGKSSSSNKVFRLYSDYLIYYQETRKNSKAQVVLINSSLGYGGFIRDGLYRLITPGATKKIIFFRGWNPAFEEKIDNSLFLKICMKKTFLRVDHIIVLSSEFKRKLREWGYNGTVSIETTVVDEKLLVDFTFGGKKRKGNELLFLSRVQNEKGIFEAVDAVKILLDKNRNLQFTIAGNGSAFEDLKRHVSALDTNRITLKGYVKGKEKSGCFTSACMFLFPSIHGEGLPNSVLEAMAFGLPVLTTRVGGIPDFFDEGKMGLYLDSRDPEHIAVKIEYLLDRPELMKKMSEYNYNYAKEHFYASKVAKRLEKIINDVVEERI